MEFQIHIFGQLIDITGSEMIRLSGFTDTIGLLNCLNEKYPKMAEVKFAIAIDNKTVTDNMTLGADSKIVLMPPFSGG